MADENVENFDIINNFTDDMFIWIIDPNSSPQSKRYLLSKFIQEMRITYAVDSGTVDAYELVLKSPVTALVDGQSFTFRTPNANTGASTIKIDALAFVDIKRRDGTDLQAGDIPAGSINIVQYDGTNFQLMVSVDGGGGGVAIADIQNNTHRYKIDTGAANAYLIALTPAPAGYVEGQTFNFKAVNANTGASTINVNGLGVQTIKRRNGTDLRAGDIPSGSYCIIGYDGTNFQLLDSIVTPIPTTLADGAAIAFDMKSRFFDYKRLDTVQSAITLTLSNIVEGANQILSVKKNIAGDVTITLAGGGLTFYGYNDADLNSTPEVVLSGASGDIFDLSFLARTSTEIGVAVGLIGN